MGSLTRGSLATIPQHVAGAKGASASELFEVGRALHAQPSLIRALGDDQAAATAKKALVDSVFGGVSGGTRTLVSELASLGWSEPADLLEGIEKAGIRLAASRAGKGDLAGELLSVDRIIKSQPDVQLALSGKRAPAATKQTMVEKLFGKKISPEALAIVIHLVVQPRDRRITQSIAFAAETVCDQKGDGLAEVRVASELGADHLKTISTMLAKQYGRPHYIDQVVDPGVVGGVRIRVGDHVIDQSVATQLATMRRQLAS
jgi:F-type H+-transporting ATPase subunit delta